MSTAVTGRSAPASAPAFAAALVALVTVASSAGCGLLDAAFGPLLRNDAELCDLVAVLEQKRTDECGFARIEPDCRVTECARDNIDECPEEWDALHACLVDADHGCDELAGDATRTFCDAELRDLYLCAPACGFACNDDGLCEIGEAEATCADCDGLQCVHGDGCLAEESGRCADCSPRCLADAECGEGGVCTGLNGLVCGDDAQSASCNTELPRASRCTDACVDGSGCADDETCVEVSPGDGERDRGCEPRQCEVTGDCGGEDAFFFCAQPLRMEEGPGLCLPSCDPLACLAGDDDCGCNKALAHCAQLAAAGGVSIAGFACTTTGDRAEGESCIDDGDCDNDTVCIGDGVGVCQRYCDVVAPDCPPGAPNCSTLFGSVGHCNL